MSCEKYSNLIDDLVEGELEALIAKEVNLHLFTCAECASQAASLKREKELYARYLFEIEPPLDSASRFQSKLKTELQVNIAKAQPFFEAKIFAFWRFYPALTGIAWFILAGLGLVLLNFALNKSNQPSHFATQSDVNKIQVLLPVLPEKENPMPIPQNDEIAAEKVKHLEFKKEIQPKPIAVKQIIKKPVIKPKAEIVIDQFSEEEKLQIEEIQALHTETAKQLEKVELLLRAFRNIRQAEGSEYYDISYEKQQARKLLQNNFALRQRAEIYGILFTEEILSQVEPYLLDIANLENNPASEKVLEIKERVRNQNIIASLQAF